jgi:carbonic anhydrase
MATGKFVTAINCMDGRVQEPVIQWMKRQFHADFVDMITEPGPDRLMTAGPPWDVRSVRSRVEVSVHAHRSEVVAVAAHHDCAGYPVSKEEHLSALRKCVDIVASWHLPVRVLALWINDRWECGIIHDSGA